jgi:hypothetical protein
MSPIAHMGRASLHEDATAIAQPVSLDARARLQFVRELARRLQASALPSLGKVGRHVALLSNDLAVGADQSNFAARDRGTESRPLGRVMIVTGPDTGAFSLALNVTSCVACGNDVSLALTSRPDSQVRAFLDMVRPMGVKIVDWATIAAEGRWASLPDDLHIAIVTRSHVLIENAAPRHFPTDCRYAETRRTLLRLYRTPEPAVL